MRGCAASHDIHHAYVVSGSVIVVHPPKTLKRDDRFT